MRASALAFRSLLILAALAAFPAASCGGSAATAPQKAPSRPVVPVESLTSSSSGARTPRPAVVAEYAATWEPASGSVNVEARLTAAAGATLAVERGAEPFAHDVEAAPDRDGAPWTPATRHGRQFEAAPCAAGACRVRYRFALRDAARKLDDLDSATEESDFVEAPPSTWLLAPARAAVHDPRVRFRVTTPEGSNFVTGVFRAEGAPDAWDISIDDLSTSPYSAFGTFRVRSIPVPGGAIQLAISPGQTLVTEDEIVRWTDSAARAVSGYYGRFPMPGALVLIAIARGRWVGSGRTLAGGGGTVFVRVGESAQAKAYRDDWVLVHEMIHLTFPSVARDQDWAEEGIATYVEPFARVRAGLVSEEDAWGSLAEGLPNGLPRAGDKGLDHTHTWGRTYWGGALFWFLADVEIHKRTQNRMGLEQALRGINAAGGTNATRWPLDEVMKAGDRATGVPVLSELYATMSASPHPVDVPALFRSLGVEASGGRARFDDHAPLAEIRRAITHGTETR